MLVITRRVGEAIIIGDRVSGEKIRIEVVRGRYGATRLAFDSSKRFYILREELLGELQDADGNETNSDRPTPSSHVPEGYDIP